MNDQLAERLCLALEQIAVELAESNAQGKPLPAIPALMPQPAPQPRSIVAPQAPAAFPPMEWVCPVHGTNRIVPAGIAKGTGRPYAAFMVCGERACDYKPGVAAPARAVPASQGIQGAQLP